jgi:hypothetical protein
MINQPKPRTTDGSRTLHFYCTLRGRTACGTRPQSRTNYQVALSDCFDGHGQKKQRIFAATTPLTDPLRTFFSLVVVARLLMQQERWWESSPWNVGSLSGYA